MVEAVTVEMEWFSSMMVTTWVMLVAGGGVIAAASSASLSPSLVRSGAPSSRAAVPAHSCV